MAINISYKQFPEFDIHKDPETIYAHFIKYAKWFKNNHLKAYNITDKAQQQSSYFNSIGEGTLEIFEQLSNTGTDLDRAINLLQDKFKESQNRQCTIYTNFAASNKERPKLGTRSSQSLEQKVSIVTSWRVGWIPRY